MVVLLGITGAIGSGKTTFADMLQRIQPNSACYEAYQPIAEVANVFNKALKAELAYATTKRPIDLINQVLIWLPDAISEQLHHEVVWSQLAIIKHDTLAHPELYEKLFAYINLITVNPRLLDRAITATNKNHYRALLQWIGGYFVAKISKTLWFDELMRRVADRDESKSLVIIGGVRYQSDAGVIRGAGGSIVKIERRGLKADYADITESERSAITPNITVINNGDAAALESVAETLWNDIASGAPKKQYTARP